MTEIFSWSRMQAFLSCPRKYELSYIENLERIPGIENRNRMLGSAFHAGIAMYLHLYDPDQPRPDTIMSFAIAAALTWIGENTERNAQYYDYEAGAYRKDLAYYDMIVELDRLVVKLLNYHIPLIGIGTKYRVAREIELNFEDRPLGADPSNLMVEFEFEHNGYRGFVDAVLVDIETGQFVAVDWKTRATFPFDAMASIDGQLPFYAALLNDMGANITKTIMWQFKTAVPKPATINKNGQPSIAAQATTWEYWCETLPPPIDPDRWEEKIRHKLKTGEYFQNPVEAEVTKFSSNMALQSAHDTVMIIDDRFPARLSSYGCKGCDFWRLCSAPLKYGGDATDLIKQEYRQKELR